MKNKQIRDKELIEFVRQIGLLEPAHFAGIAKILGISLKDSAGRLREFSDLLEAMIDKYCSLPHKPRKELRRLLKDVNVGNVNK